MAHSHLDCSQCDIPPPSQERYKEHMGQAQFNAVRAPMHYVNGRSYEPRRVIRDWGLNFNLGNVVKYVARAGRKADEPKLQALEKAIQYLQWEIEAVRIEEQET